MPKSKSSIILGIDPGTIIMGYGLIEVKQNKMTLLDMGVLQPGKVKDAYQKLQLIYNTVSGLIIKYKPDTFAIEAPFLARMYKVCLNWAVPKVWLLRQPCGME